MTTALSTMIAVARLAAPRLWRFHQQLADIADARDPRGWVLSTVAALGAALPPRPDAYLISDAAPRQDTFMGYAAPPPADRASALIEGVLAAHAARRALRLLDGELPDQPLATTLDRRGAARTEPSDLRHAAFLLDGAVRVADLGPPSSAEPDPAELRRLVLALATPGAGTGASRAPLWPLVPLSEAGDVPFVSVCLDDELPAYLRHSHRRAWRGERGPWLGLGRAGELRAVSTSHFVVDGYGHAWLTATIAAGTAELSRRHRPALLAALSSQHGLLGPPPGRTADAAGLPPPLGIAYRALPVPSPRITPLAYRFGQILARRLGSGTRSPTVFIPVAPGDRGDPMRLRRRVLASVVSVRSDARGPEPYEEFAARTARTIAAEADGTGVLATMHRAAANLPLPLRWKRELIGNSRGRWLGELPAALGGRACLSSIRMRECPAPPLIAVSCPVLLPNEADPAGGVVVTIVDDGERAMIAASGAGLAGTDRDAAALLDELLDSRASASERQRAPASAMSGGGGLAQPR
jgi:hypothetical protein